MPVLAAAVAFFALAGAAVASGLSVSDERTTQCAPPPAIDRGPSWSPDGRVAFTHLRRGPGIAIARPGRRSLRVFPRSQFVEGLAWSPDGHELAWTDGEPSAVVVADTSGRVQARFENARNPIWSPVGRRLAFDDSLVPGFEVVDLDTGVRRAIGSGGEPAWSADGTRIAYTGPGYGPGLSAIHVVDADGGGDRIVAGEHPVPFAAPLGAPQWRPRSTRISYLRRDFLGGPTLWLVDETGTAARQLTKQGFASGIDYTWSPDGRRLAMSLYGRAVDPVLGVLDVVTGRLRTRGVRYHNLSDPAWSPDGRVLAFSSDDPGEDRFAEFDRSEIWLSDSALAHLRRLTNYCIVGSSLPEKIHGTPLPDIFLAGGGNDAIYARDGRRDSVACGGGRDVVHADRVDRLTACEIVLHR